MQVEKGFELGAIGNSGNTAWPHLHMELKKLPGWNDTLPLALKDIDVSLNPGSYTPWKRKIKRWDIREGFFVEPSQ